MAAASAHVCQLVRAHYQGNEDAFRAAVLALGRASKAPRVREFLMDTARRAEVRGASRPPFQQSAPPASPPPTNPPQNDAPELTQPLKPTTFAELMLEPELQAQLDEIVVELEYREALAARRLKPRSRLLFSGPPGNGKSSSGAAMASALGVEALGVHLPELMTRYVNDTGSNLGLLFRAIGDETLVVFDEVDALGATRSGGDTGADKENNKVVNTLLTLFDRHDAGVLIATTNRPDMLDPALLRRFDEHICFPPPTVQQMRALAERICADHGVETVSVDDCANFDAVAKRCRTHARRHVMRELLAAEALGAQ